MIWWVWRAACATPGVDQVVVATDSERIRETVGEFGGAVRMTGTHHQSGTDRIAEAAQDLDADILINVQGDQPLIDPVILGRLVETFVREGWAMGTLVTPMTNSDDVMNPERVKVAVTRSGKALYFSRSPIPFARGATPRYFKHIGVYAYRKDVLLKLTQLERSPLEEAESLEQLRALENGYEIGVVEVEHEGFGVETPADLEQASSQLGAVCAHH